MEREKPAKFYGEQKGDNSGFCSHGPAPAGENWTHPLSHTPLFPTPLFRFAPILAWLLGFLFCTTIETVLHGGHAQGPVTLPSRHRPFSRTGEGGSNGRRHSDS